MKSAWQVSLISVAVARYFGILILGFSPMLLGLRSGLVWAVDSSGDSDVDSPVTNKERFAACRKPQFQVSGLRNTSQAWFYDYLDLDGVELVSDTDLKKLEVKILTTDIFSSAQVEFDHADQTQCRVMIKVEEKWTKIPVFRGVYGGGTPLLVLGGYETHSFGRLWAAGAELRRYGDLPPGFFAFFKSPRAWRGLGLWGGELWQDRRRRAFFDQNGDVIGHADSDAFVAKAQLLYPVVEFDGHGSLQAGFHSQISREAPSRFQPARSIDKDMLPKGVRLNSKTGWGANLGGVLAIDTISIQGLNMNGVKGRAILGLSRPPGDSGLFAETEWFGYWLFPRDVNLAAHLFTAKSSDKTLSGLYYLGGFDSVRGLPDGISYGNQMAYVNLEARIVAMRFKYAHIQPVVFIDSGSAWLDGENFAKNRETSVGGGVRVSIPQVYRLSFRFDYGVSVQRTKSRGFSIGLNQFFQPYKLTF